MGSATTGLGAGLLVAGGVALGAFAFQSRVPPASPDARLERIEVRIARVEEALTTYGQANREALDELEPLIAIAREAGRRHRTGGLATARLAADQTTALATLRNLASAQAQIQASGRIDTDQDGVGEYAGFLELSGAAKGRMHTPLSPPVLSEAFATLRPGGVVVRSGYCYRVFLPGPEGHGLAEPTDGFTPRTGVDADLAETTWCAFAWPLEPGPADRPTFFINQAGDILATQDALYVGLEGGPPARAAFAGEAITSGALIDERAADGAVWRLVN